MLLLRTPAVPDEIEQTHLLLTILYGFLSYPDDGRRGKEGPGSAQNTHVTLRKRAQIAMRPIREGVSELLCINGFETP